MDGLPAFLAAMAHVTSLAKAILETRDKVATASLELEFGRAMLELQKEQVEVVRASHTLLLENETLKKQIAAHDKWELESARYELIQSENGPLVYCLKPQLAGGEPTHWLCATCFSDKKKSILQRQSNYLTCQRDQGHELHLPDSTVVGIISGGL